MDWPVWSVCCLSGLGVSMVVDWMEWQLCFDTEFVLLLTCLCIKKNYKSYLGEINTCSEAIDGPLDHCWHNAWFPLDKSVHTSQYVYHLPKSFLMNIHNFESIGDILTTASKVHRKNSSIIHNQSTMERKWIVLILNHCIDDNDYIEILHLFLCIEKNNEYFTFVVVKVFLLMI